MLDVKKNVRGKNVSLEMKTGVCRCISEVKLVTITME